MSGGWCRLVYMAKKQTRRSVSMNRFNYDVVRQAAATREMTVAGLVEFALGTVGVPVVAHPQQSPELVGAAAAAAGRIRRSMPLRCSVSMNRRNYEAAKKAAASRGMTIASLVESALGAVGVPVVLPHPSPGVARSGGALDV
jgi:predicted DNA-binding ribbon-helix-helix protein